MLFQEMNDSQFPNHVTWECIQCNICTLESGIVVPVGIIVLVGTFARFDKGTVRHFHLQM